MEKTIAIIAEQDSSKIPASTWKIFAFAKKLETFLVKFGKKSKIIFCLVGENTEQTAELLSIQSGCKVICCDVAGKASYHPQLHKQALLHLMQEEPPDYILAPHSTSGMDYAPALSIALDGSCITAVEDIETEGDALCFIRSLHGGKIQAGTLPGRGPLVLTLQPGAFDPETPEKTGPPSVTKKKVEYNEKEMIYEGQTPSPSQGSGLLKAEVIVSGGRGIGEEENYEFIERLAEVFPRSATGASRPICDYGWAKYSKQVGATGTIVAPKLYIACGISGATQHLEGMRESRFIVAINKDPEAPIFKVADICIIEELTEFIPVFVETAQKRRRPAD